VGGGTNCAEEVFLVNDRKLQTFDIKKEVNSLNGALKEGEDYYLNEQGLLVFTAKYHLKRGYCCQNGCRHCPYGFRKKQQELRNGKEKS